MKVLSYRYGEKCSELTLAANNWIGKVVEKYATAKSIIDHASKNYDSYATKASKSVFGVTATSEVFQQRAGET